MIFATTAMLRVAMNDRSLLKQLELIMVGRAVRIRDLEQEVARLTLERDELKKSLDYNINALSKADAKLIEERKD